MVGRGGGAVNDLGADVVCHVGDIADGTVDIREKQASPLASVPGPSARVYVTGNHEYFSEAQGWLDYMESIGWAALHNRHVIVERGGDRLIVAGVDDATAKASGVDGHGADLDAALAGADRTLPVFLLAHQPSRFRTPCGPASISRFRGTPTAARSGRSISLSAWTNRWCTG